ncbi:family 16 glycosylhydrolase [Aquimarina sp. MMG016]|uniref:family 16 glycosylhydrolase n=1 Tax=Aquimarina sp. MMG016 TaxID=2822690 RepID=UPI001B39FE99|nr:family 16 glycosylhydrolase [Aquimarina sp. MMG016]MBQ4822622.1 family 16 glycosylhydrolase [Aquimarina sp. MMG016]
MKTFLNNYLLILAILFLSGCTNEELDTDFTNIENSNTQTLKSTIHQGFWENVFTDQFNGASYVSFENNWNYLYPWGSDHNGSARMYGSSSDHNHIYKNGRGYLTIKASRINWNEGNSSHDPWLPIRYHSGAIYAKKKVNISDQFPEWSLEARIAAPSSRGTWPAFWITHDGPWNAESDIMEYKGSKVCWQNTWDLGWEETKTTVYKPGYWHTYKVWITKEGNHVDLHYYIDGIWKGQHRGNYFTYKNLNIILNLQMEGASGNYGPAGNTYMFIDWITVDRKRAY